MLEPQQGYRYADLRTVVQHAEAVGFEAFFRSDHYTSFGPGPELATTDAWATLAALARDTTRIRLGTLVSPVTFRHPGELAKVAATIDDISSGRVEVGLGAGWFELEHQRYGFPMPPITTRFDMLEDSLALLEILWGPDGQTYQGKVWSVVDTACQPKPVQLPHPPIILGGRAGARGASLAARYAAEYNVLEITADDAHRRYDIVAAACSAIGRDPATLTGSVMLPTVLGRDSAEVDRRIDEGLAESRRDTSRAEIQAQRGRTWLVGSVDEAAAMLRGYQAAGAKRVVFQVQTGRDLDHIELLAELTRDPSLSG
jgi:F420-dependent oxidoreductase-like protein